MAPQRSLFDPEPSACQALDLGDGCTGSYTSVLFEAAPAQALLGALTRTTPWRQDHLHLYGKRVAVPRLQSWHAEPAGSYTYSGIRLEACPWTPALLQVKQVVEAAAGATFDSALVNLYRDGRDSVAWHSDDEPELGPEPLIATASFGAPRRFVLRRRGTGERLELLLEPGSLLLLGGATQRDWEHQVPRTAMPVGPRVSVTLRRLGPTADEAGTAGLAG